MRFVWSRYVGSDWFEVWAINHNKGTPEERIFVGHPEDFWYDFSWYAREYGFLDVTEEVT